jgi:AraC-like DNA-binding protein/quercetin dioxygenase-like cupin family protein
MRQEVEQIRRPLRPTFTVRQTEVRLSAACPVRLAPVAVREDVRPHDHDYYEIVLVRGGRARHRTDVGESFIGEGTCIVVPPGAVHAFANVRRLDVMNVYYLSEWLLADVRSLWDQDGLIPLFLAQSLFRHPAGAPVVEFNLNVHESEAGARELADVQSETRAATPSTAFLRAAFMKFLIGLSRAYAKQATAAGRETGFGFRPPVWVALDHVERTLLEGGVFSVSELAGRVGTSPDHLCRVFRAATGRSPSEYFQHRRAQQAGLLLLNPQRSVTDVAYELGYADSAHLSRSFRRLRGMSPRAYRKMYAGERSGVSVANPPGRADAGTGDR